MCGIESPLASRLVMGGWISGPSLNEPERTEEVAGGAARPGDRIVVNVLPPR
jgi:hypothetical protein